ncbi:MAG: YidC/Oxa1 family membrane protein insertase [Candidatus Sericytochromatia bacterium]|nr:YidC/Oxa1 family membrane protein insertase [Candidatus Sericytochromatia bacterium]
MNPIDALIQSVMIPIIRFFHGSLPWHNYGLAIVCLTVLVKTLLFPLNVKQFSSMRIMQRLQPKLRELQEAHKDDPAAMQAKMMELYKEHNTTPLSGCMPVLFQLPVLFALYGSLNDKNLIASIKAAADSESSFLFIRDLLAVGIKTGSTLHWDNIALIAIFAFTSWMTQKMMMTNPNDPFQRQMLFMSPLMAPLFGYLMPSGVLLYIVVSGLVTIVQYTYLLRRFPPDPSLATQTTFGPGFGMPKPGAPGVVDVKAEPAPGPNRAQRRHGGAS